jgi:hypothetical protein
MTPKTLHLNKLLKLFELRDQKLTSALRAELRAERDRYLGLREGGGDFYGAFWKDAKWHVRNLVDLRLQTDVRIEASKQRKRLYPMLAEGFLAWFRELGRTTNEQVSWSETSVHNHHLFPGLELTVKVDNLLSLRIGDGKFRLVYPYFTENPALSERWARVGLWVMSEALPDHSLTDMEILDVLRATGFRGSRLFLKGDEGALLSSRYAEILAHWDELRAEYDL